MIVMSPFGDNAGNLIFQNLVICNNTVYIYMYVCVYCQILSIDICYSHAIADYAPFNLL